MIHFDVFAIHDPKTCIKSCKIHTYMNKEVQKMCLNCFNLRQDGLCKVAWITKRNQVERATAGFCGEAQVLDVDGNSHEAVEIKLSENKCK